MVVPVIPERRSMEQFVVEKFLKRRSGQSSLPTYSTVEDWCDPAGATPPYKTGESSVLTAYDARGFVGWDIPDYHRKLRSGQIMPHTPWCQFICTGNSDGASDVYLWVPGVPSSIVRYWTVGNSSKRTEWHLDSTEVWTYAPERYDMYVQEAAAKIYSSGHDTLTFLSELIEVKRLFAETAIKLLKLKIPKNLKALASEWLSARYGWRTLIYDINQLSQTLSTFHEKRTRYSEKCRGRESFTSTSSGVIPKGTYDLDYLIEDKVTVRYVGSVVADVSIPKFQFNPLVTGWELVPYSFVLDWFVSVGKSLSAMSFLVLQSAYSASCGFRVDVERTYQHTPINLTSDVYSISHWQNATCNASLEIRKPCRVPLVPHLKLRLNSYKIIDLVGLLLQKRR